MPNPNALLKTLRQLHLYIGIFISPAILFFAFTGALQTFSLHEASRDGDYKPAKWILQLAQLHKNQNIVVTPKKPKPDAPKTDAPKPDKADKPAISAAPAAPTPPPAPRKSHLPMKIFFLLVAVSLCISTLSGIYMAYRFGRNKWIVTGLLIAGIIVPLILLPF